MPRPIVSPVSVIPEEKKGLTPAQRSSRRRLASAHDREVRRLLLPASPGHELSPQFVTPAFLDRKADSEWRAEQQLDDASLSRSAVKMVPNGSKSHLFVSHLLAVQMRATPMHDSCETHDKDSFVCAGFPGAGKVGSCLDGPARGTVRLGGGLPSRRGPEEEGCDVEDRVGDS